MQLDPDLRHPQKFYVRLAQACEAGDGIKPRMKRSESGVCSQQFIEPAERAAENDAGLSCPSPASRARDNSSADHGFRFAPPWLYSAACFAGSHISRFILWQSDLDMILIKSIFALTKLDFCLHRINCCPLTFRFCDGKINFCSDKNNS